MGGSLKYILSVIKLDSKGSPLLYFPSKKFISNSNYVIVICFLIENTSNHCSYFAQCALFFSLLPCFVSSSALYYFVGWFNFCHRSSKFANTVERYVPNCSFMH
jgi:hypothetical protein